MTAEERIEGLKKTLHEAQERIDPLEAENAELKQINKGYRIDAGFRETRIQTLRDKLTASEKKAKELEKAVERDPECGDL